MEERRIDKRDNGRVKEKGKERGSKGKEEGENN
jgi:hypothetical protein